MDMDIPDELTGLPIKVIMGVIGYFIIFFVVSPVGGFLLQREVDKRTAAVVIFGVSLGIFNIIFVGIAFFLPLMYPEDEVLANWSGIVGFLAGLIVSVFVGMYMTYLDESGSKTALEEEMENIDKELQEDELRFTFEDNRRERLKKRKKRGRR
jgi:predicted permease